MGYFTQLQMISNCLGLVTVNGEKMIEKYMWLCLSFFYMTLLCLLRVQRNNQLLHFSKCEAEYIVPASSAYDGVLLRQLLINLKFEQYGAIDAWWIMNQPLFWERIRFNFHFSSKHIYTEYHFSRECIRKEIQLKHVQSKVQVADMFTKAL